MLDKRKRKAIDRRKAANSEPYEVEYFARKHNISRTGPRFDPANWQRSGETERCRFESFPQVDHRSEAPHCSATSRLSESGADSGTLRFMSFLVEGVLDDHTLSATLATAKEAFAQAIEWHDRGFSNVTLSNGSKSYSIVSFALAMASLEIANVVNHAADATAIAIPAQDSGAWIAENDPEAQPSSTK